MHHVLLPKITGFSLNTATSLGNSSLTTTNNHSTNNNNDHYRATNPQNHPCVSRSHSPRWPHTPCISPLSTTTVLQPHNHSNSPLHTPSLPCNRPLSTTTVLQPPNHSNNPFHAPSLPCI